MTSKNSKISDEKQNREILDLKRITDFHERDITD